MIKITNSIPSGITGDPNHSTLIVRILDRSSSTQNDFTFFALVSSNLCTHTLITTMVSHSNKCYQVQYNTHSCSHLWLLCVSLITMFCSPLQDNGFEIDLAPFVCRQVEISVAVATNGMTVSSYSPSTTVLLSDHGNSSLACSYPLQVKSQKLLHNLA